MTVGARPDRPIEDVRALVSVLDAVRAGVLTRPDLTRVTGLGRAVVDQRLDQLARAGLVGESDLARSTGGRRARRLRFRAELGLVIGVELGATSVAVGVADLSGRLLFSHSEVTDVMNGPEANLALIERLVEQAHEAAGSDQPIWAMGVGIPGPVEYSRGRPIAPPIMPGWDDYPVRDRLARRFTCPVWVDNEVNVMALGEARAGIAQNVDDMMFLKIGTGIGAGLVAAGVLYRGAQGVAGDVGHTAVVDDTSVRCRCGNTGCLEAVAGGGALGQAATVAAETGTSPYLAGVLADVRAVTAADVSAGARRGDAFCVDLLARSGRYVGRTLATLVNFFNPSVVVVGGGVAAAGDLFLATLRETVYARSLPLATRDLRIVPSSLAGRAGLHGATALALEELFSQRRLPSWLENGSPVGLPELATVELGA